jgi:predicted Zn-dependent protease
VKPIAHRDTVEFALMRARAIAIGSESVDALAAARRQFEQRLASAEAGTRDPAPWYGLASVAHASRDWAAAEKSLARAREALGRDHVFFQRLGVANSLGSGDLPAAMERSAAALRAYPDNLALIRLRAQVLIAGRSFREAAGLLREKTAIFKGDPELWRLLAEAHQGQGERGLAHKAAAEGYLLQGMRLPAIEQLRLARSAGDLDFYNGSIVDAKLRETEAAYREEMRDARR